jgi:hypothetical protein
MKLALSFTANGWPTALNFGALGCGVASLANDLAASGGQGQFHINSVNIAPHFCHTWLLPNT